MIGKRQKPLIIFGEFNIEQVIEFARASRQHKKAQKVSDGPGPDKAKRKRGRPKKALSIKETSLPLDRTFNSFWKIFSPFLKHFLNFLSPKITIKAIFFWALYLYIVKFIDIKNIDINNLSISNFNFNDVLNFLLRKELPLVSCKG